MPMENKMKNKSMKRTAPTTSIMTPINAPLPQDFAFNGYSSFQTRYKINPRIGKKKQRTAKPELGASAGFFPVVFVAALSVGTPQLGQMTALSSISLPQFLQNIIKNLPEKLKKQFVFSFRGAFPCLCKSKGKGISP